MKNLKPGLYIIPTPIGNLEDITLRSLDTLKNVDQIYCEDTRTSQKLLQHFGIKKQLFTYNDHSTEKDRKTIIEKAKTHSIGLISDAGMPLISDPGYKLVQNAQQERIYITALPGPCALINGLVLSSFPTDKFSFLGFFEEKKYLAHCEIKHSLIFYISPHQIKKALLWIKNNISNRKIAVCKEISKIHERAIIDDATTIYETFEKETLPKGEFILIFSPPFEKEASEIDLINAFDRLDKEKMNHKEIVNILSQQYNVSKKTIYQIALQKKIIKFK